VGSGGLGVDVDEARVMIGGEWQRVAQRAVGWPCLSVMTWL